MRTQLLGIGIDRKGQCIALHLAQLRRERLKNALQLGVTRQVNALHFYGQTTGRAGGDNKAWCQTLVDRQQNGIGQRGLIGRIPNLGKTETEAAVAAAEAAVEVISVTGKRVAYANNVADESAKLQQASISNVMDLIDKLPGVNVGQGDAFGSDDYTTTVSMRGFVIDRADQQLGITIDGIPNGGSAYGGGSKANRYLDSENTQYVEVGQGSADIASASLDALGGTLNFVSTLAGYMTARDGTELVFAIFTGDLRRRAQVKNEEQPQGAGAWVRRSKVLQSQLLERWDVLYGR